MRVLGFLGVGLFVTLLAVELFVNINYNRKIGNELELAANASTVEIALEKLDKALTEIEAKEMTEGYTSILYRTPDEDVGYWYTNLKTASEELREITPQDDQLLRSNMLLKLRETILDQGERGSYVVQPEGIHKFPNNKTWAVLYLTSFALMIAFWKDLFLAFL